jgi:23S rRNA-/tRNA-specific pseudouridylate synthase
MDAPLETGKEFSLLDVVIYTGVTHQIRCHLAAAGHPIAGDALYGSPLSPRHWLHASRILLNHPATGSTPAPSPPLAAFSPELELGY